MELLEQGLAGLFTQSLPEWIAVLLGISYLVLMLRQNIWAWPCAFVSTAIFTWVFWDASLLMESALNVYYMAMAVYGFWHWSRGKKGSNLSNNATLPIQTWPDYKHVIAIIGLLLISGISGYLLSNNTHAVNPYIDSFTTWGAVFTTYLAARKIFENWYYWLVVDSFALYLYIERELYPTALLMVIYLVLVFVGIYSWSKALKQQRIDNP